MRGGGVNPNISFEDIFDALSVRLKQFGDMVTSNGGKFFPIIHPFLHCKKEWTKEEAWGFKLGSKIPTSLYSDQIPSLITRFLQMPHSHTIYNANDIFKDSKETLFKDFMHMNDKGAELLASYLYSLIEQGGEV